jgi:hypothetical protein
MQEFLDYIATKWNVDIIIVLIVLLSGFFQSSYLTIIELSKNPKTDSAWKTLTVSFVASMVWIIFTHKGSKDPLPLAKYFFSYFLATSLYELLINPFKNWIVSKFNLGQIPKP